MCHFITLVASTADVDGLRRFMTSHGRAATPVDNPSVAKVLRPGERQYLTTRRQCDCDTVLAARDVEMVDHADMATRLRRKGWSEAKIARAVADQRKAEDRPDSRPDSLELWAGVLQGAMDELGLARVGLLVHLYEGRVADEAFALTRRAARKDVPLLDELATMKLDQLTVFERV